MIIELSIHDNRDAFLTFKVYSEDRRGWIAVGDYKLRNNEVAGREMWLKELCTLIRHEKLTSADVFIYQPKVIKIISK
jgi:hypothetical protein